MFDALRTRSPSERLEHFAVHLRAARLPIPHFLRTRRANGSNIDPVKVDLRVRSRHLYKRQGAHDEHYRKQNVYEREIGEEPSGKLMAF